MKKLGEMRSSIINLYLDYYSYKDAEFIKECKNAINDYFDGFSKVFNDVNVETFLGLTKNEVAALREYYGAPKKMFIQKNYLGRKNVIIRKKIVPKKRQVLLKDLTKYGIKNPNGLITKFIQYIGDDVRIEVLSRLFSYEHPGFNSIIELKRYLPTRRYQALENLGYVSIQELTQLSTDQLRKNWREYPYIGDAIIDLVHSRGFLFANEFLNLTDEIEVTDVTLNGDMITSSSMKSFLMLKKKKLLNVRKQNKHLICKNDYLISDVSQLEKKLYRVNCTITECENDREKYDYGVNGRVKR